MEDYDKKRAELSKYFIKVEITEQITAETSRKFKETYPFMNWTKADFNGLIYV